MPQQRMRLQEVVMVGVLLRNLVVGFDGKKEEAYRKKKVSYSTTFK